MMAKLKWVNQSEIDAKEALKHQEKAEKEKFKGKSITKLKQSERDELLEKIAKDLGYL